MKIEPDVMKLRRRDFLRKSVALAGGGALMAGGAAHAAPLAVPQANREPGRTIDEADYGMPSKFEQHVKRRRTDVLKNRQNLSDWSMTPLQHQPGIITPNGLIFERHHAGTPDIDPTTHRLVIHGMVKQALQFTMEDLVRYPSVSRFYFHECSGNGLTDCSSRPRPPCSRPMVFSPECCGPGCPPRSCSRKRASIRAANGPCSRELTPRPTRVRSRWKSCSTTR